ncbi:MULTISPECIES: dual specificity protein phosphatase family protein [unclassified Acinetobacter]|uniref:dual specificity protein phosphatase family protein n=1 Tax=unclassified Acinetobacter TaxID=196816 RepID=UPI00190C02DF|nr:MULTISPECIES: dual specificity protein phosphatase family protein [unclassified Acinetobacter]MBK0062641.1 dual specificity protein phosphatase family protein [Acinetobacter sp. S55]MBK0065782.1 dual specificity protein phosphatase family protein [Acinetobacter sp. S54]
MKTLFLCSLGVCVTLNLSGCITHPSLPLEQRPTHWGNLIKAEHNFYKISPDVYRSEQPSPALIAELRQQQIQTVINLRSRNDDLKVLDQHEFNLIHVPIHTWAINRTDLLKVMQHIQNAKQNRQKVLLHCYHGSDRTGASIAMYRIVFENWSIENAVQEMKYGHYGYHPIWVNIEHIFTPENVKWIREQLSNPSENS